MGLDDKLDDACKQPADSSSEESKGTELQRPYEDPLEAAFDKYVPFMLGVLPGVAGSAFGSHEFEKDKEWDMFYKGLALRTIALGLVCGIYVPMFCLGIDMYKAFDESREI